MRISRLSLESMYCHMERAMHMGMAGKRTHRGRRPTRAVLAQWIIGKGWTPFEAELLSRAFGLGERIKNGRDAIPDE